MENRLKPETTPIINTLNDANIRTIMVTGKKIDMFQALRKLAHTINRDFFSFKN